jgi:hypothetical protein
VDLHSEAAEFSDPDLREHQGIAGSGDSAGNLPGHVEMGDRGRYAGRIPAPIQDNNGTVEDRSNFGNATPMKAR